MTVLGPIRYERTAPGGGLFHPLADIFPWLDGDAKAALDADIAKNGVHEPIVFFEGRLLDGRNRYMAARKAGIEYPAAEYTGDDAVGYVISKNLQRRHLNESQRAMLAAKLAKMPVGANQHLGSPDLGSLSVEQAAEKLKVGRGSVENAKVVQRDAVPDLVAAVETGKVAVSAAAEVAKLPASEQQEAVDAGPAAVRAAAKTARAVRRRRGKKLTPEQLAKAEKSEARRAKKDEAERAARMQRVDNLADRFMEHATPPLLQVVQEIILSNIQYETFRAIEKRIERPQIERREP